MTNGVARLTTNGWVVRGAGCAEGEIPRLHYAALGMTVAWDARRSGGAEAPPLRRSGRGAGLWGRLGLLWV